MSYLSRPRIGFFAKDAMTNPSTANNENVIHFLDYQNVTLLNPPAVVGATLPEMSPAAYREWMTSLLTYSDPLAGAPSPTNQPDWQPGMPGYWNYWGDHMTTWGSATVNSLWYENGLPVTTPGSDPLFGARVVWHARICDVDPADTWSTQFISSGFSIVGPDASGAPAELVRGVPTTSFTRWLNFFRYAGAGTFQSVIPTDGLTFIDDARAPRSDAFTALRDGARAAGGLMLRYCFYGMTTSGESMLDVYDGFAEGGREVNPKVGRVLGTIGVWNGTDMISTPVGRVLQQPGPPFFAAPEQPEPVPVAVALNVRTHKHVEDISTPGTQLHAESELLSCVQSMAPAVAVVDRDVVALDLLTAFPEIGCDPNASGDPFAKHDFGAVSLWVAWNDGDGAQAAPLGAVRYDQASYEQLAGICEVPFASNSAAGKHVGDGLLSLRCDEDGTVLLQEIEVAQVETDDRAVYLDLEPVDGGPPEAVGSVRLRAFQKGEPIAGPLPVQVQFWLDDMAPGAVNSINPLVVMACSLSNVQSSGDYTLLDSTEDPSGTFNVTVPAGGELTLRFRTATAGCFKLRFIPPGMTLPAGQPAFAVEYYTNIRVLPLDDYAHVPDEDLTFRFIFDEVLSYYSILYPVMSTIIPWGPDNTPHDPDRVAQFAALMSQAVDASRLDTALQMPITRELSAGKRALLQRWCALQMRTE